MIHRREYSAVDVVVFLCSVCVCLVIGIVFAVRERRRNTTVNYFLANRNYRTLPVALSFVVTFQSSIMILGIPAESYAYGIGIAYFVVGTVTAYLFAALFIVPVLHPLKLTSVYGYFNLRYGNNVLRYMTLFIGITYNLFYMAIITVGTSVAMEVVFGIPFWATILIYTVLASIYTSVGGIKAVIWTDVFQLTIMVSGTVAILIKSTIDAGGSDKVFEHSRDRLRTDFRIDPTIRFQFWNVSFGSFSTLLNATLTQQAMQRVFSTPTVKTARCMYLICAPIYALFLLMAAFEGATIFAYFVEKGCDILGGGLVNNINAIVPFAILELFRHQPGLAGLFTASLSSAALSTQSSCLNSLSAVTFEDMIKVKFPDILPNKATRISKLIVLIYGLIAMVLAFALSKIPGSITAVFFSFMACLDGPMCSVFLLSIMFRRATTKGIVVGTFCGMAVSFWLNMGSKFSNVPPYPYLSSGPTGQCYKYVDTPSLFRNISNNINFTALVYDNVTSYTHITLAPSTLLSARHSETPELTTLQRLYSISYILFSMIGLLTSLLIGIAVSLFTKPPEQYDNRCLFSFRKHVIEELCANKMNAAPNQGVEIDEHEINTLMGKNDAL